MRTRSLLWTALTALAVPAFLATGCGDDSPTGGSGGGTGGNESGGGGSDPTGGSPNGGSGGEGGSGGSGGAPANDTCASPGAIGVAPGEKISVQGTVAGATDDYQTFCADNAEGESANEVVYQLDVSDTCTGKLTLSGGPDFQGVISVRDACMTAASDISCDAATAAGASVASTVSLEMGTYFVLISDLGSGDSFALDISCVPPTCGDFILDDNEECDFGTAPTPPAVDGDGCDNDCNLDPVDPDVTDCDVVTAGPTNTVDLNQTVIIPGSTINGLSTHDGSCQDPPVNPDTFSKENIIKVRPTAVGTMTITLGLDAAGNPACGAAPPFPYPNGCWDRTLYVRTACGLAATEIACSESFNFDAVETVTIPVAVPNIDYYVFVDGWLDYFDDGDQSDVGTYDLRVTLTP